MRGEKMEKSNMIISIIIVLCIAAGVTAYGVTNSNNGFFKTLQEVGSDAGTGPGNVSLNTSNNDGNGNSEGTSDSGSGSGSSGSSGSGGSNSGGGGADPTVATYTITTQNDDGGYTISYYNAYDEKIGFIRYDAEGNQIGGGGGAPGG